MNKHLALSKLINPQVLKNLTAKGNHNGGAVFNPPPGLNVGAHGTRRVGEPRDPFPNALPKLMHPHFPHPKKMPIQPPKKPAPFPNDPIQPGPKPFPQYFKDGGEPWKRPWRR